MALPYEMTQYRAWCVSTMTPDPITGKPDKAPRHPADGRPVSPTDPTEWATYEECATALAAGRFPVMGFVLSSVDPYVIVDLDHPHTDTDRQAAESISAAFNETYQEISTSGTGIHIICRGALVGTGRKKHPAEIYCTERYMICTGNTFVDKPITNQQDFLNLLYAEMQPTKGRGIGEFDPDADDSDCARSDIEILEIGAAAENGAKFNILCAGEWQKLGYPSQSEADLALFNMLAFYSSDNSQCVRIFRMTKLGQREKAQRNDYMAWCVGTARAALPESLLDRPNLQNPLQGRSGATSPEPPLIDIPEPELAPADVEVLGPEDDEDTYTPFPWPPGWTGHLAHYMHSVCVRPVPEVGIISALGLCAGIGGRSYNTETNAGLNSYQILVAPTGVGKEGIDTAVNKVILQIRETIPAIESRIGPSALASGQALVKVMAEKPCCVSILGEFGHTLARISDPRATGPEKVYLQVLLDMFSKSGHKKRLNGMAYSDKTKNVPVLDAPCFSFIGETTPLFYEDLNLGMVESGLLPRIHLFEYTGKRPRHNATTDIPMDPVLLRQMCGFALTSLAIEQRNGICVVGQHADARKLLDEIDAHADEEINKNRNEAVRQIWNRHHLKVLKIASLLAAVDDFATPKVSKAHVEWAKAFCENDIKTWLAKFEKGQIGSSDLRGDGHLTDALKAYGRMTPGSRIKTYEVPMAAASRGDIIPHRYIVKRLRRLSFFQKHPKGTNFAISSAIKEAVQSETLLEMGVADKVTLGLSQNAKIYLWKK